MRTCVTHNGGTIRVNGKSVPVYVRAVFVDDLSVDTFCPDCLAGEPEELADFIQFGMLSDVHDLLLKCCTCGLYFVIETELKA